MKFNKLLVKKLIYIIIAIILLLSIFLNTYLLLKYNVLPVKFLLLYALIVGIIPIFLSAFTIFKRRNSKLKIIFATIEIIYIIVLFIVFFYLNRTFNFIDKFTKGYDYETKNYYVLVLNNSELNNIDSLKNKSVGYVIDLDTSMDAAIKELEQKYSIKGSEYKSYTEIYEKITNKELLGLVVSQSYYDMLIENGWDSENIHTYKILYKFSIKEKKVEIVKDVDVLTKPFNIYLSGIDSYGSVTDKTRSDVNIIVNVNPVTNKIILVNVPRDYYVELPGTEKKDKLTHAGMYGVDMSIKALENLLDIEINYYVKVNYNAIINLVDALDGVDVYSEYNFKSFEFYHPFKKGINHVDGKLALDFVRTRKAFRDGDRVRGENQQRMIQAIFKKVSSPKILVKYNEMLKALDGSFTTNISTSKIMSLINMQLDKMPSWEISSMSLNGTDAYDYTYTYPSQQLYVMVPKEETVNEVKNAIKGNE